MNGLITPDPSPGALRMAVGAYLLLFVQTMLLMLVPVLAIELRPVMWLVTFISGASFIMSLCGLPYGRQARGRHDR